MVYLSTTLSVLGLVLFVYSSMMILFLANQLEGTFGPYYLQLLVRLQAHRNGAIIGGCVLMVGLILGVWG